MESQVKTREAQSKRKKIKLKKYYIKDVGSEIYTIGLCRQRIDEESSQNESESHRKLRHFVKILLILLLVKSCSLLIYYQNQKDIIDDENVSFWFGGFFFSQPQIRK